MFNVLKYTKTLEAVCHSREQAEAQVIMIAEIMENNLASSQDLKDLKLAVAQDMKDFRASVAQDMKDFRISVAQDMKDLRLEISQDMKELRAELENKLIQAEYRITIKLGTIVTVAIATTATIFKFFLH